MRGSRSAGASPAPAGDGVASAADQLSGCELEVLHMIGHGRSTRAIAAVQSRSVKTIETYRCRIRAKLCLKDPTALAQTAWRFVHRVAAR